MKISFFGFHLLETHAQHSENEMKMLHGHFDQKQKCSVFYFVRYS